MSHVTHLAEEIYKMKFYLCLLLISLGSSPFVTGQGLPSVTLFVCNWDPSKLLALNQSRNDVRATTISRSIRRPVALDYDPVERQIYWTDVNAKRIGKIDADGNRKVTLINLNNKAVPDGLAIDIGAQKLFYTDTGNDVIVSTDMKGTNRQTILDKSSGLDEPRAIILDTIHEKIFYTDWGVTPHIATAYYDGSDKKNIISNGLGWPNGLALDKQNNKLFWCDAKTHRIETARIDGTERQELLYEDFAHYFDIFYLDHSLYFTDWNRRAVMVMSAAGGALRNITSQSITKPAGLHVISNSQTAAACPPRTYGQYCQYNCGHCNGSTCNNVTGHCPSGCLDGWEGHDCKTPCAANTYGPCVPCGRCANNEPCQKAYGYCLNGCQLGWSGIRCDRKCSPNTYGSSCTTCGHCEYGESCDKENGHCPGGCREGWTGPLCKIQLHPTSKSASDNTGVIAGAVGGTLALLLIILTVVIVVAVFLARRMKLSLSQSTSNRGETRQPRVFSMPVAPPPAYSNPSTLMASYSTTSDQAILVTNQQFDNNNAFSRPESEVTQDEKGPLP